MDSEINYRNKRHYNTAKYPIRQSRIVMLLIWIISRIGLIGKDYTIEKHNMEGVKPPYILLSNHMGFMDFMLCSLITFPHRVNNVVSLEVYYRRPWLMELVGSIGTRKFTTDLHLVKSIHRVLKRGDILCMYPEARYSPCGTTSQIPDSIGKLVRMNKVPVVTVVHHGNHLYAPFWGFRKKRKVRHLTTVTQTLTADQAATLPTGEINRILQQALSYDEYQYQKDSGILIAEPRRAEGLHKVLYQCPHCMCEFEMDSKGSEIFCKACGKRWLLQEDGTLAAENGETEFPHVPDWYRWEQQQVRQQIERGQYSFSDEVTVYSQPRCWRFHHLGRGQLTHTTGEGFILTGTYRNQPYRIQRTPAQTNSLHVDYDSSYRLAEDCLGFSTEKDSFFCYPKQKNVVTKLLFATEILYQKNAAAKKGTKRTTEKGTS